MNLGLRHLRCFLAIAQERNITKAAAVLFMTQPALSRCLRQLEDGVGLRLVDRSTRHLSLTPEGELFRTKAAFALHAFDEAVNLRDAMMRPLRVGHAWSAFGARTRDVVEQWSATHPGSPLELKRIDDKLAGLLSGAVDVAILRGDAPFDDRLHVEPLPDELRFAAIPRDHPLTHHEVVCLDELLVLPFVFNVVSGATTVDLWRPQHRPEVIEVGTADDWLMMIVSGKGFGITPSSTRHTYPHAGVSYVQIEDAPPISVRLAWRRDVMHPLLHDFVELVRQTQDVA